MSDYCVVCRYVLGHGDRSLHLIPQKPEVRKAWLEAVQVEYAPKRGMICNIHFKDSDWSSTSAKKRRLKTGAVPHLPDPLQYTLKSFEHPVSTVADQDTHLTSEIESTDVESLRFVHPTGGSVSDFAVRNEVDINDAWCAAEWVESNCIDESFISKEQKDTQTPASTKDSNNVEAENVNHIAELTEAGFISKEQEVAETPNSIEVRLNDSNNGETENVESIIVLTEAGFVNTCRFCLKERTGTKNIFEDHISPNLPIYLAMKVCLYPIKVSSDDFYSKYACSECLNTLSSFVKFRALVLRNDKIMRKHFDKRIPSISTTTSAQKRNIETENEPHLFKKLKIVHIPEKTKNINISKQPNILHPDGVQEKNNISKENFDSGQQVENLINQLDNNESSTTAIIHSSTLVESFEKETNNIKQDSASMPMIREENFKQTYAIVEVSNGYQTIYDNLFCMDNGYLMEHKILKGNLRYLKCALAKCPAVGIQEVLIPGQFKNTISITRPHNHKKPTENDIKKQKFISVIRKKLQSVKGSSIKTIYDEVCKMDPDLAQLVPMKEMMNEICNL